MSEAEERDETEEELKQLKKAIEEQLVILRKAIEQNSEELQEHFELYGDLYRRYEDSEGQKQPTEVLRTPLSGEFRLVIKSLIESIHAIDERLKFGDRSKENSKRINKGKAKAQEMVASGNSPKRP